MRLHHPKTLLILCVFLVALAPIGVRVASAGATSGYEIIDKLIAAIAGDDGAPGGPTLTGWFRRLILPKGGGHGGAGASSVPIIDEDFKFMVQRTREHLGADDAHQVATGAGVTVAVMDGGFNLDHPDLVGRIHPLAYDAIEDDWDPHDLGNRRDDNRDGIKDGGLGHGTFVASMVLQAAPDATILPIRIRDDEGWGFNIEMARGLWVAWQSGAQIVNISGWPSNWLDIMCVEMLKGMYDEGVTIIVSAGYEWDGRFSQLAEIPDTLSVAATDMEDRLAPWCTFEPMATPPMVLAPGVDLYGAYGVHGHDTRAYWSGTSFATGLVSGAAALLQQLHPDMGPPETFERLMAATVPAYDMDGMPLMGTGRIDLRKVVMQP